MADRFIGANDMSSEQNDAAAKISPRGWPFGKSRGPEALATALAIFQQPRLARLARRSPLPAGMTFLLEAAAGDPAATMAAIAATGRSETAIRKAAGFFIEQVLLSPCSDSYRILGADSKSPGAELRRHMALLMRWLHPDAVPQIFPGRRFDRSTYATRITNAWDCLKTPQRRAAYAAAIGATAASAPGERACVSVTRSRLRSAHRRTSLLRLLLLPFAGGTGR